MEVLEQPQAVGGPGAGVPAGPAAAAGGSSASALAAPTRRGPAAWLRHTILRAQAVAEDKPLAEALGEYEDEADDASYDEPGAAEPADLASFITLPEHLLEKIFGHLRGSNRKHHFAICGVNRQWRRLGQAMFFSRPWEVAHLICHPTQLFCLSPRNVTGSRSGLLKCFVRRENGPGGKRFTFHIGKDAAQPQRSRFLMAAKHGGRDTVHLFMNSRCAGPPCARLRCNLFATQYKLLLSDDLHLEPSSGGSRSGGEQPSAAAGPPARRGEVSRLTSWPAEAAAEAAAAAQRIQQQRLERQSVSGGVGGDSELQLPVNCFAELQYQARVKGFMQPRRMRVVLPHPSLLFYDQVLPQLSRRTSEAGQLSQAGQLSRAGSLVGRLPATPGGSSAASPGASPEASPPPASAMGPAAGEDEAGVHGGASGGAAVAPAGSRVGRWVGGLRRRRQLSALLRQQKTVPAGEALQSVVLQNKAPHWNEGLRCWCLNFRGRVKLASVKNFQLVRADDPAERVVMQFGKAEQDAFILDFNPTVLTAFQAFAIVLSTFDSKLLL
ncbi:hypothetical protein ABPG77_004081 [Micractinium sp. CCAP 211/92]